MLLKSVIVLLIYYFWLHFHAGKCQLMQSIFQKENADKALKYRLYRHLPAYEKIIRNLVSFSVKNKILDWKNHAVKVLTDYLSWIRFWKKFYSSRQDPFEEEHFLEALSNEWKINAYLDILLAGSGEEIAQFFMDKRKEVADIEQRMEEYQRGVLEEIRKDCRG